MKVRRRALLVATLIFAVVTVVFTYGVAAGHYHLFPFEQIRTLRRQGDRPWNQDVRWATARESGAVAHRETLERLGRLGYVRGYTPPSGSSGAVVRNSDGVYEGLTLFTSGHAPVARLISIDGEVGHEWEVAFEDLWPGELPFDLWGEYKHFLRRAHVFPNGDLLAIFEYAGIVRLDKESNVIWMQLTQNHHDFAVTEDGTIITLERRRLSANEVGRKYPGFEARGSGILDDQIAFRDPSGRELKRVSLFEAHQELAMIRADEVLVSLRDLNAVVSVSAEEPRVAWMISGMFRGQHQASMLDTGRILLLDNGGGNLEEPLRFDQSEVLEFDPVTQAVVWRYTGSETAPFFTHRLGYVQRLPNGNSLVTETQRGRIFEVTRNGLIVWEYLNPGRAGERGELIATVMGAQRLLRKELTFLDG